MFMSCVLMCLFVCVCVCARVLVQDKMAMNLTTQILQLENAKINVRNCQSNSGAFSF